MSSTLTRSSRRRAIPLPPPTPERRQPSPRPTRRPAVSDDVLTIALVLLMLAAAIPMRSVFIGSEWVRPITGAIVLSLGLGWGSRRLGAGPIVHLLMSAAALLVFTAIAFLPTTAIGGLVPTLDTLGAARDLFLSGLELVELRPSPTFAEAGLLLLAVTGVWTISYLADGMLFVLRSPLKTIACAVVLWTVPLAVAPPSDAITLPAAALLASAGLLMLLGNALSTAAFGVRVGAPGLFGQLRSVPVLPVSGVVVTAGAIALGLTLAAAVPGFGEDPLYEARGGSGTTITTNPIVDIKQRLVASDTGPVVTVDSVRPVYLRTTSLDSYDANEQWTAGTISGQRVQGIVDTPPAVPIERVDVGVSINANIETGAVLAPAPYQALEVTGPKAQVLRYDRRTGTLTVPGDEPLVAGDTYRVQAGIPQPTVEALRQVPLPGVGAAGTELPDNVPDEVIALARQIAGDADATTMFDVALAVQDQLRTWDYSTQPDPGLGATAMLRFIDARQGYCEQFAGTMAVMLRAMGIPTRLAVGYTPGTQLPDGQWQVTNANAHAWVEVDFGALGWIPFEPTPRTDDNVLVTGTGGVVPPQTLAQQEGLDAAADPVGPGEFGDQVPANDRPSEDPFAAPVPGGQSAAQSDRPWSLIALLLALVGVGTAVVVRRRGSSPDVGGPAERILTAQQRAQRVGQAVGRPRHRSETNEEYFARLARGHHSGSTLARPATRAVYAPSVSDAEADAAEKAAASLEARLTNRLGWGRLALVRIRMLLGR